MAAAFNGVKGVVRNDFNGRDATITSIGWNTKFQATDDWTFGQRPELVEGQPHRPDRRSYSGTGR
jgi:iron complex outermembrane receptor protein